MFGLSYSKDVEIAQCRKSACFYLGGYRATKDAKLRVCYRAQFRAEMNLIRALKGIKL